jgi:divalent metal cation (Fe/Co/Zn/Cd) transporter
MKLMNDERKILESDKGQLVLTSHRVRFDASAAGQRNLGSIMLDELCSCELNYKSHLILILLALLSIIFGFVGGADTILAGAIGAIVFPVAYFLTKKQILSLSSAGGAINIEAKGMKSEDVKDFIDAVELAKFEIRK